MIRFMVPEKKQLAGMILSIPQKRSQRPLIGFLYPDEILKVYQAVDLSKSEGLRDYTLLHLLYDSGARASEIADQLSGRYWGVPEKALAGLLIDRMNEGLVPLLCGLVVAQTTDQRAAPPIRDDLEEPKGDARSLPLTLIFIGVELIGKWTVEQLSSRSHRTPFRMPVGPPHVQA